jgi:hypothetical protein
VSHRVRYFHRLCTQSSLPTFQNSTTQKSILVRSWSPRIISRDLQLAVESLESWFRTWRIDVNPEKSNAIFFTKRHFRPAGEIAMFNRVIPSTTVVKYLGVKFDNHLTFIPQVEHADLRRAAKEVIAYLKPAAKKQTQENWRRTDGRTPPRSEPTA